MDQLPKIRNNEKRQNSMNFVFVDYENVSLKGLTGIEKIDSNTVINILYSKNTTSMPVEVVAKLSNANCDIRYYEIKPGKNALDFILSSILGYYIKENYQEDVYYIVSKDKGYESLCEFWRGQKVIVKIVDTLNKITTNKGATKKNTEKKKNVNTSEIELYLTKINCSLGQCLKGETKEIRKRVADIIVKTKSKKAVKNSINQFIKDKNKANSIFTKIEKLIKDKKD